MIGPLIGIGGIAFILLVSEALRAAKVIRSEEVARKFVHILTGIFVAVWPLFISFRLIQLLSVLLLAGALASKYLRIFKSIHRVRRRTYGELFFPAGIFVSAMLADSGWIYLAAILHLTLADGFAAVVGVRHVKKASYRVFGQAKTLMGSVTFYVISLLITLAVVAFDGAYATTFQAVLIWLPLTATLVENIAVYGTDNILVPVVVIGILNSLQTVA